MPVGMAGGVAGAASAPVVLVESLTKAIADIALAAAAATTNVGAMGLAITGLVAKANPAVAQQFTLALNDTFAVIGQALVPILKVATEILRMFGDMILSVSESIGGTLGTVFESMIPVFEALFAVFAQVGQIVAEVFVAVAPLILVVMRGIKDLFDWISNAIREVLAFAGIDIAEPDIKKGASVGAAVRTAQHSSVDSVIQAAQKASFSLGTASKDPAGRTASAAEAIKAKADEIYNLIKNLPRDLAEAIGKWLGDSVFGERADKVAGGIADAFDTVVGGTRARDTITPFGPRDWAAEVAAMRAKHPDGGGTVGAAVP